MDLFIFGLPSCPSITGLLIAFLVLLSTVIGPRVRKLGVRARRLYGGGRVIAGDAALPLTTVPLGLTPPGR
jgi:hypothetical protein